MKSNPVPIYLIFYGNWNGTGSNTAASVSLIEHFVSTLGNSAIEHVATTYGDNTGNVSGNVSLGGVATVSSSTNLNDRVCRPQSPTSSTAARCRAMPMAYIWC